MGENRGSACTDQPQQAGSLFVTAIPDWCYVIATLAVGEPSGQPDMVLLSKLGGAGLHLQNLKKELFAKFIVFYSNLVIF